jgi:hypothetical protein
LEVREAAALSRAALPLLPLAATAPQKINLKYKAD